MAVMACCHVTGFESGSTKKSLHNLKSRKLSEDTVVCNQPKLMGCTPTPHHKPTRLAFAWGKIVRCRTGCRNQAGARNQCKKGACSFSILEQQVIFFQLNFFLLDCLVAWPNRMRILFANFKVLRCFIWNYSSIDNVSYKRRRPSSFYCGNPAISRHPADKHIVKMIPSTIFCSPWNFPEVL